MFLWLLFVFIKIYAPSNEESERKIDCQIQIEEHVEIINSQFNGMIYKGETIPIKTAEELNSFLNNKEEFVKNWKKNMYKELEIKTFQSL